jgi:hypothetical protein
MPRAIIAALAALAAIVAVVGIWPRDSATPARPQTAAQPGLVTRLVIGSDHRRLQGYGPPTKHDTFRLVRVSPSMSHCSATSTPSTSTLVCIVRWSPVPG